MLINKIYIKPEILQQVDNTTVNGSFYLNGMTFFNGEDTYNVTITDKGTDYKTCKFKLELNGNTYTGEALSLFSYGSSSIVAYTFPADATYTFYSGAVSYNKQYGIYYKFDQNVPITAIQWNYYKATGAAMTAFGLDWSITINDDIHPKYTKINYPEEKYGSIVKFVFPEKNKSVKNSTNNKYYIKAINTIEVPVENVKKIVFESTGKMGLFGLSIYGIKGRQYNIFDLTSNADNITGKGRVRLIDKTARFTFTASSFEASPFEAIHAFNKVFQRSSTSVMGATAGWISNSPGSFTIEFNNEIPISKVSFIQPQSSTAFPNFSVKFYDQDEVEVFTKECVTDQAKIFDIEVE